MKFVVETECDPVKNSLVRLRPDSLSNPTHFKQIHKKDPNNVEIRDIKEVKELKNEDLSREGDVGRPYHSTMSTAGTFAIAARGKQIGFILIPKSSSSCSHHPSGGWPRLVACVVKDDGLKV